MAFPICVGCRFQPEVNQEKRKSARQSFNIRASVMKMASGPYAGSPQFTTSREVTESARACGGASGLP